jgi:hypothetical protein
VRSRLSSTVWASVSFEGLQDGFLFDFERLGIDHAMLKIQNVTWYEGVELDSRTHVDSGMTFNLLLNSNFFPNLKSISGSDLCSVLGNDNGRNGCFDSSLGTFDSRIGRANGFPYLPWNSPLEIRLCEISSILMKHYILGYR